MAMSRIIKYAAMTKMSEPIVKPIKIGSQDAMSVVELMELLVMAEPSK